MKKLLGSVLISSIAIMGANAHEVWLDLDDKKAEAKLYFGHFAGNKTEGGKKFERIKEGVTYPKGLVKDVKRNDDNITYTLNKKSDIVALRESKPRKARNSETVVKKISYSKAGRSQTEAISAFDIVPVKANSNTFKVVYNNEIVKKSKIVVISPTEWTKSFMANDKGEFTIQTPWVGTYLIKASYEDNTKGEVNKEAYDKTVHSLTYTIKQTEGLPWNPSK